MRPIEFKEITKLLTKPDNMTDEECGSLPVFTDNKQCISCWRPTFWERLKILFVGRIWLSIWSGQTQPPVWISVDFPFL